MWKCHKCGKPVYFAERRQSLGFDWHPYCLKCQECGKVLNPGQHAEHKGGPYCHIPCYAALFGPKLFGHGSTTESHRSFGQRQNSFVREQNEMQNRLNDFNRYYQDVPRSHISSREANGKLVLEGVIKIYWGTEGSIRLKEFDDTRLITRQRKAMSVGYQFEDVKIDDIGDSFNIEEIPEEETSLSLPYFNPLTHPLLGENLEEKNEDSLNGGKNPEDVEFDEFDDIETESFLSYDPLHKWETLYSLVDSKPDTEYFEESVDEEFIEIPTNGDPEIKRRSLSLKPSDPSSTTLSHSKSVTLPSSLSNIKDDLDDLLCVERNYNEHDRVYHTVHGKLPVNHTSINISDLKIENGCDEIDHYKSREIDIATQVIEEIVNNIPPKPKESQIQKSITGKKFVVEKLPEQSKNTKPLFKLGAYEARSRPKIQLPPGSGKTEGPVSLPSEKSPKSKTEDAKKSKTPRTLRRRPGRKMDKNKLKRRTSFNGHWYDRDTSVFVPPKHAPMCVYTTSKSSYKEVLSALLEKYKIESESDEYALYVVKETGERRVIKEAEFPLLLRVNLGPHEEIAKIYLMDREATEEISHSTAQYIRFSFTELRSFLNMFYEEEEREADRIRTKYLLIRRRLQRSLEKCSESNQGHLQTLKG